MLPSHLQIWGGSVYVRDRVSRREWGNYKMETKKQKFASDTSGRSAGGWAKALVILLIGLTVAHLGDRKSVV